MAKIKTIRGDDVQLNLAITDADGLPFDITGYTVFFTLKDNNSDDDDTNALIEKEVTSHVDAELGETAIVLDNTDTDGIEPGTYFYDIQLKSPSGIITSFLSEKLQIIGDVTRRTA